MSALDGRIAVVTGTSRGIGRVIADQMQEAGATVVGLARTLEESRSDRRLDLSCDVTDESAVQAAVDRILADIGVPNILVNNAGVFLLRPLTETTLAEFDEQLSGNVVGPFLVLRTLLPHLARSSDTHIVTVGSVADHRPYTGNAAYAASKFGARGLHGVLAEELRGTGIRTTLVSPGPTDTRIWDAAESGNVRDLPARDSMLHPSDVADAVLYAVTQPSRVNVEWIQIMPSTG